MRTCLQILPILISILLHIIPDNELNCNDRSSERRSENRMPHPVPSTSTGYKMPDPVPSTSSGYINHRNTHYHIRKRHSDNPHGKVYAPRSYNAYDRNDRQNYNLRDQRGNRRLKRDF